MPEIIAKDGASVRRTPVPQGFVMYPGERIDFILTANATGGSSSRNDSSSSGGSNFWIQVSTLAGDNSPVVLSYEGAPDPASDSNLGAPQLSLGCQLGMPGVIDTKLSADLLRPHGMTDPPPKFVAGKTKKKQVSALLCVGCIVPDHKGAAAALTQSCLWTVGWFCVGLVTQGLLACCARMAPLQLRPTSFCCFCYIAA